MTMIYKGRELTLPLSDENREFLIARSKDTLLRQLDREWASIENHRRLTEGEGDEDEVEEEEIPYSEWKNSELKEEIDGRNADREEGDKIQVKSNATKDELVAALEADDAVEE